MGKVYLLGVDLGTTGTKAAIFDECGTLVADAYEESKLFYPKPGWVTQDPEDIYGSATRTIRECLDKSQVDPASIAALSFDGQMAGIGSVDSEWGTPTPYDSWLDTRCRAYIDLLRTKEDLIIALTGGPPSISHGAKILWWKHEQPETFRRIAKFVVPGGYVAGRIAGLKGEEAFIDYTYLHFSCFSDTANRTWSTELLESFDVPIEKMPRIVNPWEIIGRVTKEAAQATGLLEGTPVAAGCGDQAAGMLGAGMVKPGMIFDVAGTASVFAACIDRFATDRANRTLFTAHLPLEGLYYVLAYINGGGLNLRWFRDEIAKHEKRESAEKGVGFYASFDREAAQIPPGSDSLIFLPHLGGRVCPSEPSLRGVYFGLHWSHSKAHLYRAMLEGVAFEYAVYQEIVKQLLPELEFIETRVIGGGAGSPVWNQIKADVLNVPYLTLNRQEFAVLGSAILAGFAVGVFEDMAKTAQSFVSPVERIEPRPEFHQRYLPYIALYKRLLNSSKPLFDDLAAFVETEST
ncbi:MAG: FGGY family carbohydrate kinase [Anaerolineales bacterium]|nr:FGGY family carbohydrate kinase [Anaerolineales bacterium]MCS7248370.1 FGGY family carbohydrate kinase [Anaerolineales bacterium]MDW8162183.1 FGGY family carbohydrate kinase [Anaerolineales bacterium]MDW8447042.1 FGGY family carbohydrate kinase [Anaerolineales bacterium]